MDAMERYFFDLNGFIVVPQARPACVQRWSWDERNLWR
jgi:hypothetical protein